ncbi:MAG: hypothetical protein GYA17_02900, partial [Chloroflexi bacterium]|nr:hypothetical protein [Chloroflexota bacterium]
RAAGQLTEIREADLRFSLGEAVDFLNRVMGLHLDGEQVRALEARTEGWVAGLQLAALTLQRQEEAERGQFIAAFTGSSQYVLEYLSEEVINRQPPAVQDFLLQTAILERLSPSLCAAVWGEDPAGGPPGSHSPSQGGVGATAMLGYLRSANLFLIPLDDRQQWYRYHHLFADLLRSRLRQDYSIESIHELHRRAGRWYQARAGGEGDLDYTDQAVYHALEARDYDWAANLIEQVARATMLHGRISTLLQWAEMLPEDVLRVKPRLRMYQAWLHFLNGKFGLALSNLNGLYQESTLLPPTPESEALRGELATLLARGAALSGKPEKAISLAQEALARLPEDDVASLGRAYSALGIAHDLRSEPALAQPAYERALDFARASGNAFLAVHIHFLKASSYFVGGRLRQAEAANRAGIALGEAVAGERFYPISAGYLGLAEIAVARDELDRAGDYWQKGQELCLQGGPVGNRFTAYRIQAQLEGARGDLEKAHKTLQGSIEAAGVDQSLPYAGPLALEMAHLEIDLGQYDAAIRRLAALGAQAEPTASQLPRVVWELRQVALARAYRAKGEAEIALQLLEEVETGLPADGHDGRRLEIALNRALCYQAGRQDERACAALATCLEIALREGQRWIFRREGAVLGALLEDFLGVAGYAPAQREFAAQLLRGLKRTGSTPKVAPAPLRTPQAENLVEPLSERELEVLRMIQAGYSNQEIADRLFITIHTVKKHTSNIFEKLSVSSRTQALAAARRLGWIDPGS